MKQFSTYDIAEYAGINQSTVSRVLSGFPHIKPETVKKVKDACRELNYTPNAAASSLRTRKSKTIGIHLPDETIRKIASDPFVPMFLLGANSAAAKRGYSVMISSSPIDSAGETIINTFRSRRVDGFILLSPQKNDHRIDVALREHIPSVLGHTDRKQGELMATVDIDNEYSGYLAGCYLASRGYRRIGVIAEQKERITGIDFIRGFKRGIKQDGLLVKDCIFSQVPNFFEPARKACHRIISTNKNIDAIVTTTPLTVFGALKAVEDLRNKPIMLGVDSLLLSGLHPTLPRLIAPIEELGKAMGNTLIDILEKQSTNHVQMLKAKLIDEKGNIFEPNK